MSGEPELVARIERLLADLPPHIQERLWSILAAHAVPPGVDFPGDSGLLCDRASVVRERRKDGAAYWRLYIESGTRYSCSLKRKRIYIGKVGGPKLKEVTRLLREAYFGRLSKSMGLPRCRSHQEMLRCLKAALAWDARHLYDRHGNYFPDGLARALGYGGDDGS